MLWNIGIFALNFGPVVLGPILDFVGPKLTAILGESTQQFWDGCVLFDHPYTKHSTGHLHATLYSDFTDGMVSSQQKQS